MESVARSLSWLAAALALATAATGLQFVFSAPVTGWFTASACLWIALMVVSMGLALKARQPFFHVVAALFCAIVVGRLYGTVRLSGGTNTSNDPLLLAETGPGVPLVMWLATALAVVWMLWLLNFIRQHRHDTPWGAVGDDQWGLWFVRVYVGMMFIAHFSGHIFAGPEQFAIFEGYFGTIGLHPAAGAVVLGGVCELVAGIGLSLGLFTRLSALVGAAFLFLSMLWGQHFPVGYIWILPTGGWEFGIFWAAMVGLFVVTGGGTLSLDHLRASKRAG